MLSVRGSPLLSRPLYPECHVYPNSARLSWISRSRTTRIPPRMPRSAPPAIRGIRAIRVRLPQLRQTLLDLPQPHDTDTATNATERAARHPWHPCYPCQATPTPSNSPAAAAARHGYRHECHGARRSPSVASVLSVSGYPNSAKLSWISRNSASVNPHSFAANQSTSASISRTRAASPAAVAAWAC